MPREFKRYVPQGRWEIRDLLASMMLGAPDFRDELGDFPDQNLETEFEALNDSLLLIRKKLGEERYTRLAAMSAEMKRLFEADPEDKTGETRQGRAIIDEMRDLLAK